MTKISLAGYDSELKKIMANIRLALVEKGIFENAIVIDHVSRKRKIKKISIQIPIGDEKFEIEIYGTEILKNGSETYQSYRIVFPYV